MRFKATIASVSEPFEATSKNGETFTKRFVTLNHPVVFDDGKSVDEKICAEYFGDVSNEELLQLASDKVLLDVTVWFGLREWTNPQTNEIRQFQTITLKSLVRTL